MITARHTHLFGPSIEAGPLFEIPAGLANHAEMAFRHGHSEVPITFPLIAKWTPEIPTSCEIQKVSLRLRGATDADGKSWQVVAFASQADLDRYVAWKAAWDAARTPSERQG